MHAVIYNVGGGARGIRVFDGGKGDAKKYAMTLPSWREAEIAEWEFDDHTGRRKRGQWKGDRS